MDVYALVGPSGTGKSHQAITVAYEHDINTIIDDGLLIRDGQRLAGSSAKGEKTAIRAVKRAIFVREEHRAEVKKALLETRPDRLLVLGTSARMADRICEALDLPLPCRYLTIDQVATPGEIATAKELRNTYGMHVIPLPVVEIKENLKGYLMRPIRFLLRYKSGHRQGEKTIIQPKFSLVGKLVITDRALDQIITFLAAGVPGVARVAKVQARVGKGNADIHMELTVRPPGGIPETAERIRRLLEERILLLCGINVEKIDISVRNIVWPGRGYPEHTT